MVGVLVVVGWTAATLAVQLPPVGDGGTLALPTGQSQVAMWATAAVLTLRRMVPPVALLLAVPLYVVVMSLPLYDLGPPGGGGGVLSHTTEFHLVPILAVAYLVAESGAISPVVAGAVCLAGTGALFVDLDGLTLARGFGWSGVLFSLFVVAGTTFLGALVREQRRLRAVESQKVVVEERTRIARELHDVVAHHMSAIVIRAQAAERLAPGQPEVAVDALRWIADTGKEALTGMRHAVQVLREADRDRAVELAPHGDRAGGVGAPAHAGRPAGHRRAAGPRRARRRDRAARPAPGGRPPGRAGRGAHRPGGRDQRPAPRRGSTGGGPRGGGGGPPGGRGRRRRPQRQGPGPQRLRPRAAGDGRAGRGLRRTARHRPQRPGRLVGAGHPALPPEWPARERPTGRRRSGSWWPTTRR